MDSVGTFLRRLRQGTFTKESFEAGITLVEENLSHGLPDDNFKLIIDIITKQDIRSASQTSQLIKCLVPEGKIANKDIDRIILWILTYYDKKPASVMTLLLQWIVGVIEFGLADKSYISGYYELFYSLLFYEKLEKAICHLLFLLTRSGDVYRGRVLDILKLHERNGKLRHTMALLSLFKSYRPEYVPEQVQIRSIQAAFSTLKPSMANNLSLAQSRLKVQDGLRTENDQYSWSRLLVKPDFKLIPDAAYVHMGSNLYQEKKKRVIECLDKGTLMSNQHCVEVPSRALTLLLNEGGIHLLATHNPDVHVRFSYVVYYTLRTVLIDKKWNVPREEIEYFLKQLVDLEDYMQQGIPVISRFLSEYICTWDGLEYRECIYRLLERITFKTNSELEFYILDFLNTLFITGSVEEKCLIIRTLQRLIMNLEHSSRYKSRASDKETLFLFLGVDPFSTVDADTVVLGLVDAVDKLCVKGLQMTNSHPLLLHTCIIFYEMVAEIEFRNKSWFMLPRACVYRSLLGPSVSALSRTCDVLLKHTQIYSEIKAKSKYDRGLCAMQISLLSEYSFDIYNCLIKDMALSKAYQGYIFKNLTDLQKRKFSGGDSSFSITSTIPMNAFLVYVKCEGEDCLLERALRMFGEGFVGLHRFVYFLAEKAGDV